jgi:hypothetical protein
LHIVQNDTRSPWTECKLEEYDPLVARILPRFDAELERIEDERRLGRLLLETGEAAPPKTTAGASNGGDWERLRGLPAIGRGVSGAVRGSDPLGEVLRREHRLRRRR